MATKPELNIAGYADGISSAKYNDNFDKLNDYIEAVSEELMLKVNTINSQLSSNVLSNLQSIYPVGSLYIGTTNTCPIANLFGTWEKVAEGRVLQGVKGDQAAGTTVEAGLPNITGSFDGQNRESGSGGCFYSVTGSYQNAVDKHNDGRRVYFDASRSSSIYGKSSTVQPPAYLVNIWKRTA